MHCRRPVRDISCKMICIAHEKNRAFLAQEFAFLRILGVPEGPIPSRSVHSVTFYRSPLRAAAVLYSTQYSEQTSVYVELNFIYALGSPMGMGVMPKVVILCGGQGTRLREETEFKPKPLVQIGEAPILWHIMEIYAKYGCKDFVLCLGYKGRMIKEFFMNYEWDVFDFSMNLRDKEHTWHKTHELEDWNITFANTGEHTQTGGRVKAISKYIDGDDFFLTYGDGVGDVDIEKLYAFHRAQGKMVTITCVHPQSKFGVIKIGSDVEFVEKPPLKDYISGGFMVCKREFLTLLEDSMFEQTILPVLARNGQIATYLHDGFWHAMDTYKDYLDLNTLWKSGNAPWKV
jgi:glucose-1-phosphate cytidylyltransferase